MRPPPAGAAVGARAFHDATKHSRESVRSGGRYLDWGNKPFLFKVYPDAPAVPLPREIAVPALPALDAVARVRAAPGHGRLDLPALAQLLFFSAGLTKKKVYPGGEAFHFRAAASTGALYEVEVYVVVGAVAGLEPGVYHFCPGDFVLRRLRAGDRRGMLAEAASRPEAIRDAPATIVLSAIYWRNTWKYEARAFRHFFWNSGTLLANLLATAVAADLPASVLLGFADAEVHRLLGLDDAREGSLALVPLGAGAPAPAATLPLEPLNLETVPLSAREEDYPLVRQAYRGSTLDSGTAAHAWAGPLGVRGDRGPPDRPLEPAAAAARAPLGEVILRRGSTRVFAREATGFADLSTILDAAVRDLPLDVGGAGAPLVDGYVLVHAVDGLPAGAYALDPLRHGLRTLRLGEFRDEGGYLCLEQALGADASAVVFFLADLRPVLERYGNRGYRAVNLAAGLLGGRMYLAAYALGLGASGLTFYDDDVVGFFSPDAAGKDAIFVTALGRARRSRRRSPGLETAGVIQPLRPGES